ncbi:hypothetical protein [Neptuniibacter sp.]|uniref:hypothetical protein n=1 Tax=Neptuniibacter sp. TaxID=1962643 RepID=UPI00262D9C22|nr:hypothetical protein [Neptuniibacter sp.]MCP4597050.1 hypothetical protein [Neptuniibacter sp.]
MKKIKSSLIIFWWIFIFPMVAFCAWPVLDGILIGTGVDQDEDIVEVNVTGTPKIFWDESEDQFSLNKGLDITGGNVDIKAGTLNVGVSGAGQDVSIWGTTVGYPGAFWDASSNRLTISDYSGSFPNQIREFLSVISVMDDNSLNTRAMDCQIYADSSDGAVSATSQGAFNSHVYFYGDNAFTGVALGGHRSGRMHWEHRGNGTISSVSALTLAGESQAGKTGTITLAKSLNIEPMNAVNSTITEAIQAHIQQVTITIGYNTLDKATLLELEAQTAATDNWAIMSKGGKSAHAGDFSIGKVTAPATALDVEGDAQIGDGTNQVNIASDGEITLSGTARVVKEAKVNIVSLAPGASGANQTSLGTYAGWAFGINDDMLTEFEIPFDWDSSTAIELKVYWAIDEAYGDAPNGEIQWEINWSACPTGATEAIDAPTHTGTIDFGDQNLPATAKYLTKTSGGTIASASLTAGDLIGFQVKRVALDGGTNPTAEPIAFHIEVEYTSNKLGEAT